MLGTILGEVIQEENLVTWTENRSSGKVTKLVNIRAEKSGSRWSFKRKWSGQGYFDVVEGYEAKLLLERLETFQKKLVYLQAV